MQKSSASELASWQGGVSWFPKSSHRTIAPLLDSTLESVLLTEQELSPDHPSVSKDQIEGDAYTRVLLLKRDDLSLS
jgi:hypothetical protein